MPAINPHPIQQKINKDLTPVFIAIVSLRFTTTLSNINHLTPKYIDRFR